MLLKFLIVIFTLLMLFMIYVGYRYVKQGMRMQSESKTNIILLQRRKNAKNICPIKSAGTSMDNREIYVLTLKELGLTEEE